MNTACMHFKVDLIIYQLNKYCKKRISIPQQNSKKLSDVFIGNINVLAFLLCLQKVATQTEQDSHILSKGK